MQFTWYIPGNVASMWIIYRSSVFRRRQKTLVRYLLFMWWRNIKKQILTRSFAKSPALPELYIKQWFVTWFYPLLDYMGVVTWSLQQRKRRPWNSCEFSFSVFFKKFQDLRKKNVQMKSVKVPRKRKRRRHKKGVLILAYSVNISWYYLEKCSNVNAVCNGAPYDTPVNLFFFLKLMLPLTPFSTSYLT